MTRILVDTSVLIKWFHTEREAEVIESRALRSAHLAGSLTAMVLDLAIYELGNVLVSALRWKPEAVAAQLVDLITICGAPRAMVAEWFGPAAELADRHGLTFYDAAWAAAAQALAVPLVSADRRLLGAGLALSPTAAAQRLLGLAAPDH